MNRRELLQGLLGLPFAGLINPAPTIDKIWHKEVKPITSTSYSVSSTTTLGPNNGGCCNWVWDKEKQQWCFVEPVGEVQINGKSMTVWQNPSKIRPYWAGGFNNAN